MSSASLAGPASTPTASRHWWTWIIDHNPLYLLSGLCLLLGCFLISSAIHASESYFDKLLVLLGVFNVYELLVIGLGVYLVRRRGLMRDAGWLLGLEVLLLVDVTMLYNECFLADQLIGGAVNAAAAVLVLAKIAVIAWALGVRLPVRLWALLVLDFIVIMELPGLLAEMVQAEALTAATMHGLWWGAGLLLALHAVVPLQSTSPTEATSASQRLWRWLHPALIVGAYLSAAGHLLLAHFVFDQPLHVAHGAPLLLGLAVWMIHRTNVEQSNRRLIVTALSLTGVVVAATAPLAITGAEPETIPFQLTSLRLTLMAGAFVWAYAWICCGGWWLVPGSVAQLFAAFAGPTPGAIRTNVTQWTNHGATWVKELLPTTALQWGVVALVAAFVLLGAGAALSLLRRPFEHVER